MSTSTFATAHLCLECCPPPSRARPPTHSGTSQIEPRDVFGWGAGGGEFRGGTDDVSCSSTVYRCCALPWIAFGAMKKLREKK